MSAGSPLKCIHRGFPMATDIASSIIAGCPQTLDVLPDIPSDYDGVIDQGARSKTLVMLRTNGKCAEQPYYWSQSTQT